MQGSSSKQATSESIAVRSFAAALFFLSSTVLCIGQQFQIDDYCDGTITNSVPFTNNSSCNGGTAIASVNYTSLSSNLSVQTPLSPVNTWDVSSTTDSYVDTWLISSKTLPAGTPVQLTFTGTVKGSFNYYSPTSYVAVPFESGLTIGPVGAVFDIKDGGCNQISCAGVAGGASVLDSQTGQVTVHVGDVFSVGWTLVSTAEVREGGTVSSNLSTSLSIQASDPLTGSSLRDVALSSMNSGFGIPMYVPPLSYVATGKPPINTDGSSVFKAKGVVPAIFSLGLNGIATCNLPPATISIWRMGSGTPSPVDESVYVMPADTGSFFRIDAQNCQYIYNVSAKSLGVGAYQIGININGQQVGSASFTLE